MIDILELFVGGKTPIDYGTAPASSRNFTGIAATDNVFGCAALKRSRGSWGSF